MVTWTIPPKSRLFQHSLAHSSLFKLSFLVTSGHHGTKLRKHKEKVSIFLYVFSNKSLSHSLLVLIWPSCQVMCSTTASAASQTFAIMDPALLWRGQQPGIQAIDLIHTMVRATRFEIAKEVLRSSLAARGNCLPQGPIENLLSQGTYKHQSEAWPTLGYI